ncbi:RNA polymerase factor sigma-54 [Bacillus horti]|uniref:RNA polymerase sigma-54 factor n=1 Tax=Caldalkalibacillus horti TaxID=77523 RepID=A0ABT9W4B8_9BACI|nr:RNA polymerase factor sigma-54 [Bacillus horti]MDQ0167700.1 RNA polymerase sigma-54 factor [Bacillus horti]
MQLGFELTQQLQTKLVITPELRQSITILQYPTLDLIRYLREQAGENPFIELAEPEDFLWNKSIEKSQIKSNWDEDDQLQEGAYSSLEAYVNPIDYCANHEETLQGYLLEQVGCLTLEPQIKKIVQFLIGNVNERGYLELDDDKWATSLGGGLEDWEQALGVLQQLEPRGVGARSLEECLLLQLRHLGGTDQLTEKVIAEYLADLAAKRYQKIASALKVSVQEVQQIADFISTLQPKPGMLFHSQEARYIIPDVYVQKVNGKLLVQLNDRILPRVQMNKVYVDLLKQGTDAKEYLEEQLQQVQWIERSLAQRQQTILKVAKAIIQAQPEFFVENKPSLRPLVLKQIAQEVNVHESTVSRATNHKYIQTSQGVFELKYFFSNRLTSNEENATSSQQVKQWIQGIIEKEEKRKPLSDQKIVSILQEKGVSVARRTVAKYREELGIFPSSQRKRV